MPRTRLLGRCFLSAVVGAVSLISCSTPGKTSLEFSLEKSLFTETVKRWTRNGKIYSDLDTIMLVDALYQDWSVRQEFIAELSRQNYFTDEKEQELYQEMKSKHDEVVEFMVAVYTSDPNWNDLEKKDSIWGVFLQTQDGVRIPSSSIKKIQQRSIPLKRFYPFITPWRTVYQVEFPRDQFSEDWKQISLVLGGMLGTTRLVWDRSG
jgi:hypothetical protein